MRTRIHQLAVTAMSACLLLTGTAQAKDTYGWVEKATIEPWNVEVKAKLDTGALTSSMHAEDIHRFERDGKEWVRFTLNLENTATGEQVKQRLEKPVFRTLKVSGAGGEDRRPVVLMKICFDDIVYEEQFSLRDRGDMLYPVLIGRRTIQHLGTVDVTRTFLNEPACDEDSTILSYVEQEDDEDIGVD